jgi:hypothetical protein
MVEIERTGIGIEHVAKNPAWRSGELWIRVPETHQQVEMIRKQTIGEGVGAGQDPFLIELQEVPPILFGTEDVLPIVTAAADVIDESRSDCSEVRHVTIPLPAHDTT